ncbi:hypothetical protein AO391_09400 [Pseudomonas marginalis ICMP 9505]|uniref:Uncharacterized protein n=1 Tax=Pseudomonas kitaguniensis TaxID=2607908 RepID=A0A5N7JVC8_9PSED|nr:hypothetical protein [Pseudomonas kitaguniensis]KTC21202.1 hypothetical protein AO391_09400 [Pseudomonas marginalis ICMP 9505]MPQ85305.1 hypothetical protein [Pseudomonas kitaguniensis]MPR01740.1 hypothetical protein [Pseudomonas kitaguniensis]
MNITRQRITSSLGVVALIGSAVFTCVYAVAATYNPLSGDVSVNIIAGAAPTGAVGLSTGPTGVERPVYYRPGSSDALWIGASNTLPQGCKPTEFKDDDGTAIPVWIKLKCTAEDWQGKLSKTGKLFTVKRL